MSGSLPEDYIREFEREFPGFTLPVAERNKLADLFECCRREAWEDGGPIYLDEWWAR